MRKNSLEFFDSLATFSLFLCAKIAWAVMNNRDICKLVKFFVFLICHITLFFKLNWLVVRSNHAIKYCWLAEISTLIRFVDWFIVKSLVCVTKIYVAAWLCVDPKDLNRALIVLIIANQYSIKFCRSLMVANVSPLLVLEVIDIGIFNLTTKLPIHYIHYTTICAEDIFQKKDEIFLVI